MLTKRIFLIVIGILISLIILEVGLNLLNYPYVGCDSITSVSEKRLGKYDPNLGWGYKEYNSNIENGIEYIFNEEGYRSDNKDSKTDFSKPIVIIVGNSVIFGHGINFNETFGYRLQSKLGDKYQVINMAVQGYGLDQVYIKLEKVIKKYKPKFVITDFIDDYDVRNGNRDRRTLFRCASFSATKPQFSLSKNGLVLRYLPVKYEKYDSPKIRLVWWRLIDEINLKQVDKHELTKRIYIKLEQLVNNNNATLLVINYWSKIRDFQSHNGSNVTEIRMNEMNEKMLKDDFHPNSKGAKLMFDKFWNLNSKLFLNETK